MSDNNNSAPPSSPLHGAGVATSAGIVFQQQVGALFAACLLTDSPVDARLGLGHTRVTSIRFETEAPIDDILIETTVGGFIAIQAKTKASRSTDLKSPFGKTIAQFVKYWLECRDGSADLIWNRPLDLHRDRLVLAIGPGSSASIRVHLASALRVKSQPGDAPLTRQQWEAYADFETCVRAAWAKATAEPFDDAILSDFNRAVRVLPFDFESTDRTVIASTLRAIVADSETANSTVDLLSQLAGAYMTQRGGADLPALRQALEARGARLLSPPQFQSDIEALRTHSNSTSTILSSYETIEAVPNQPVNVRRECQDAIDQVALDHSFLIVGDPGTGKSGVLNSLARTLRAKGRDVLELAVDRYSVETLEGLSSELQIKHSLMEVLDAWDGPDPAWLIIDALDATRGGKGEGVFRTLIENVLQRKGRWRVVASIRTFDLRMGQQFRKLFSGRPPVSELADPNFSGVIHVQVPQWSNAEFDRLLGQVPALSDLLANVPPRIRNLAMVPFNTRLIADLMASGTVLTRFDQVASQAELLRLYWEYRVERHGTRAETCLRRIVDTMISARALRANRLQVAEVDPDIIDVLIRDGVIIVVENGRWIQFRHHLLFDYAAALLFLSPSDIVSGTYHFAKGQAAGVMLAPALGFVLQEIWDSEADHGRFWTGVTGILADSDADPIIRSAVGRMCAELPEAPGDLLWLANKIDRDTPHVDASLKHIIGALAVVLEDKTLKTIRPWVCLVGAMVPKVDVQTESLRILCGMLIQQSKDDAHRELGLAARALLRHALEMADPGYHAQAAIGFVAETIETDIAASVTLLRRIFEEERFYAFGFQEVPALTYKIEKIGKVAPDFCVEVYTFVYSLDIRDRTPTRLGESRILALASNSRQDYDMARYSLNEYFDTFIGLHLTHGVEALIGAVDGYIRRAQTRERDTVAHELTIGDQQIRVIEDWSHIWAHDIEGTYGHDGDALITTFLGHLRSVPEAEAMAIATAIIPKASFAVLWARMFLAAAERADATTDLLWPIASHELFLLSPDTRKDAVDLVASGFDRRSDAERIALETDAFSFDFSDFTHSDYARESFLRRLFSTIGAAKLHTADARTLASDVSQKDGNKLPNDRLFVIRTGHRAVKPYDLIEDFAEDAPANVAVTHAIDNAKAALKVAPGIESGPELTASEIFAILESLIGVFRLHPDAHRELQLHVEDVVVRGCQKVVKTAEIDNVQQGSDVVERLLPFLGLAIRSSWPKVDAETEASFAQLASWGSPCPRLDAAIVVMDLCFKRPEVFSCLQSQIDALLADPHPAVRMQAALHLVRIFNSHRAYFWEKAEERLALETNPSVLNHLIADLLGRVLITDIERTEPLVLHLFEQVSEPGKCGSAGERLAEFITVFWLRHSRPRIDTVIDQWITDVPRNAAWLRRMLTIMREALIAGLDNEVAEDAVLRKRAMSLVHRIVDATNAAFVAIPQHDHMSESDVEAAKACQTLLNAACMELYFATGGSQNGSGDVKLSPLALSLYFTEISPILYGLAEHPSPHTVYYLLQTVERLVPLDAGAAFDLTARALQGGEQSGFQYEMMGANLLVKLIGIFLADHKELFEAEARRNVLVETLETLMEAGWPAARRLLYRLPELIQ